MEKYQLTIPLPTQGLNLVDDSLIADNEAAEGTVNISFKDGEPQTRKGYIKTPDFPLGEGIFEPITKLFVHRRDGEPLMLAVVALGGEVPYELLEINAAGDIREIGGLASPNPSFLPISCALNGTMPSAYGEKVLVLDNGLSGYFWFDGSSDLLLMADQNVYEPTDDEVAAYGTNVLSGESTEINEQKYFCVDNERIWVAGGGKLVRISHLGLAGAMPDYWPSTQALKLKEDVTGMVRFMGEVIIFTKNTANLISGSTPIYGMDGSYTNIQLPGGYGCDSNDSIAQGDNAVYWANSQGVYRYIYLPTGDSIPQCISEFVTSDGHTRTVRKLISSISDWTKVFGLFHKHEYHLFLGDKRSLVFDTIANTWSLHEYFHAMTCGVVYGDKMYCAGGIQDEEEPVS